MSLKGAQVPKSFKMQEYSRVINCQKCQRRLCCPNFALYFTYPQILSANAEESVHISPRDSAAHAQELPAQR